MDSDYSSSVYPLNDGTAVASVQKGREQSGVKVVDESEEKVPSFADTSLFHPKCNKIGAVVKMEIAW